jgi:hypothetical protein
MELNMPRIVEGILEFKGPKEVNKDQPPSIPGMNLAMGNPGLRPKLPFPAYLVRVERLLESEYGPSRRAISTN